MPIACHSREPAKAPLLLLLLYARLGQAVEKDLPPLLHSNKQTK
jgi:hypothetical protein